MPRMIRRGGLGRRLGWLGAWRDGELERGVRRFVCVPTYHLISALEGRVTELDGLDV